jgi:hypothetical protein
MIPTNPHFDYIKFVTYNFKESCSHYVFYIKNIHTEFVCMFIIYLLKKLHMSVSSSLLVTAINKEVNREFTWLPCSCFSLQKH